MNDPHVVALNYSILHDGTVKYDDAPPIEYDGPEFSVRVADEKVRLELKTHYATEDAALQAVDRYIRSWELGAALDGRPGQFKLLFKPGMPAGSCAASGMRSGSGVCPMVGRAPVPPSHPAG